jgi:uncharacterized membrane protein (DUF2068 family)
MLPRHEHHAAVIRLIAVFKLFKAIMLLFLGLGALQMVHHDVQEFARTVIRHIHGDPYGDRFRALIGSLGNISDTKLKMLGIASFSYSAMYFIEGIGLLLTMRWAEWMAVFTTSGFIPLELYEVIEHPHLVRLTVMLLNIAMVVYLIRELIRVRAIKTGGVAEAMPSPESPL